VTFIFTMCTHYIEKHLRSSCRWRPSARWNPYCTRRFGRRSGRWGRWAGSRGRRARRPGENRTI